MTLNSQTRLPRCIIRPSGGFTLVEVAFSMGILTFCLVLLLALLPIGIRSNQVSAQETRATFLLTTIEADLRNADPATGTGTLFRLAGNPLFDSAAVPYRANASNPDIVEINSQLTASPKSFYFDANERPLASPAGAAYRATLVYTDLPTGGSLMPAQARLLISWPPTTDPLDPTQTGSLLGRVETVLSFPAP